MRLPVYLLIIVVFVSACATTSPLATSTKDRSQLAGVWEEEWPGQQENDRYQIEMDDQRITITPLTRSDTQSVRDVYFQQKRLSFVLEIDGSKVFYDLVLVSDQLLSGRAKGGVRNFDEAIRWYKVGP